MVTIPLDQIPRYCELNISLHLIFVLLFIVNGAKEKGQEVVSEHPLTKMSNGETVLQRIFITETTRVWFWRSSESQPSHMPLDHVHISVISGAAELERLFSARRSLMYVDKFKF